MPITINPCDNPWNHQKTKLIRLNSHIILELKIGDDPLEKGPIMAYVSLIQAFVNKI